MKYTARIISRYTCDTSGVCSALYELGGMTVMHDPGGYGSIYATHDEPRWYDSESLIFVSGLTETQAILGDDTKLVQDTLQAARRVRPKFISLTGSPIPAVVGTDFEALAFEIENELGIPTFGFDTDGMHTYVAGVSKALAMVAQRLCQPGQSKLAGVVNILGVTPLDFSINGSAEALTQVLSDRGLTVQANWAMTSSLAQLEAAGAASANLVVTAGGLKAAQILQARFGTPYVLGTPYGPDLTDTIVTALNLAATTGENQSVINVPQDTGTIIIGESLTALSLATAIFQATGRGATIICPTESEAEILAYGCLTIRDEDDIESYLHHADTIIADPMYQPICPPRAKFVPLPHEAFSGRIYHSTMPNLVTELPEFLAAQKLD